MEKATQDSLLQPRQRFITEEAFGINHIHDEIDRLLPDKASPASKSWSAHVTELITAYKRIQPSKQAESGTETPTAASAGVQAGLPGDWSIEEFMANPPKILRCTR
ncbi:hypothetical protein B0H10DRAFT_2221163 [Mycena sp. CBHHK59/15]|nr:hypothetical protein B0H10DRAFT_2233997 [Mycena sp. CBHHK59/15]KAJ6614602.1 hypothetical protein B0H10DRAFT_2221163 [Mycena sp. CBHHK59/15]